MLSRACLVALLGLATLTATGGPSAADPDGLPATARALFAGAIGDPDPGLPARLARRLDAPTLIAALRHGSRAERLLAIDCIGQREDPSELLPWLGAFLEARERAVASRAAATLLEIIERLPLDAETVPRQRAQLGAQLLATLREPRCSPDVRIAALQARRLLDIPPHDDEFELLDDAEPLVREALLFRLDIPLSPTALAGLDRAAENDHRPVAAAALGLLCENALGQGADAPSPDLAELIGRTIADPGQPAEALAPILVCLARFAPGARDRLLQQALARPDGQLLAAFLEGRK